VRIFTCKHRGKSRHTLLGRSETWLKFQPTGLTCRWGCQYCLCVTEAGDCCEMLVHLHQPARYQYQNAALNSNRHSAYRLAGVSALISSIIRAAVDKYLSGGDVNKNDSKIYSALLLHFLTLPC